MRIALDAMGGDSGAPPLVKGAVMAVKRVDCEVLLVGDEEIIRQNLAACRCKSRRISVVPCSEVVGMCESPAESLKKTDSSISVAARLVREGKADALVSAGNTGCSLAHSLKNWGRLKGIKRPGIAHLMPTPRHPCLVLDLGAVVDCKPQHLLDFAIMGSVYSESILGRKRPTVGLLNNGEERSKGNALTLATYELLEHSHLNFVGNVEGGGIFEGDVDVVVCDGFTGNVVLKACEGAARMIMTGLKGVMKRNVFSLASALVLSPGMRKFKKRIDASEYGGAPLLGLNGICIISHGSSNARAVMNAIRVAGESVASGVNAHIIDELRVISEEIKIHEQAQVS